MIQKSLLIDTALACCFWTHCFHFILVHFKVWTNFFLSLFYELFHVEPKLKLAGFLDVYVRYMYACVHYIYTHAYMPLCVHCVCIFIFPSALHSQDRSLQVVPCHPGRLRPNFVYGICVFLFLPLPLLNFPP